MGLGSFLSSALKIAVPAGVGYLAGGPAGALIGSSLGSALIGSDAASDASEAQENAARYAGNLQAQAQAEATAEQRAARLSAEKRIEPWVTTGTRALGTLERLINAGPGDYTQSPGYEFRLSEGQKALERGAAVRGNLLGGGTQKALIRYGQNYATQDYDNFLNRYYQSLTPYQTLAGMGQNATNTGVAAGQNSANAISNILQTGAAGQGQAALTGGQARASGYINQANVATGAINSGLGNYFAWQNYQNQNDPYKWGGLAQGF